MVRHTPARRPGTPGAGCPMGPRCLLALCALATCAAAEKPDPWWAKVYNEGGVWCRALSGDDYHVEPGGRKLPQAEEDEPNLFERIKETAKRWWTDLPWRTPGPTSTAGRDAPGPSPWEETGLNYASSSALSLLIDFFGWVFFGSYWGGVRTWGARAMGILIVMFISAGFHYLMCAFSPVIGLLSFVVHGCLWLLRWVATWGSRRKVKKEGAGDPKTVLYFYGPAVAKYPTTATLKGLKKSGTQNCFAVLCVERDVILVEIDPQ
eukprot:7395019-Heterocapsa_arctica.AAC.1